MQGTEKVRSEMSMICPLGERTGGAESDLPVGLTFPPIVMPKANGVYA